MVKVAIVRGADPPGMTVEALEMVEAGEAVSGGRPVLIKPNYINASHPSRGNTTDGRVIEGIVRFLRGQGAGEIVVGEGSGHSDTFRAFRVAGVDAIAERWGVKLVDLNRDEFIEVRPPDPLALKRVKIAKTALESTIISVPKLKLHRITGVTLSIKNMMGAMTPKGSMHTRHLSKNIADLAVAAVGAAVMGVAPETVKHLRYAERKGLGTCDLNRIEVVGEPIEGVRRKFRRALSSRILRLLA
ncbi:MAG: DUF362 domain-containing protein [Candidatus Bathyarchaeia archaeon]